MKGKSTKRAKSTPAPTQPAWSVQHIKTSDGVQLRYLEAGSGDPLVLLAGWTQSAEQYTSQIAALSKRHRVIALDMRGHGGSEKPRFGYRISRLAKDLHDVLVALDLKSVSLLGHSMGAAIIWSYWDLFGGERLSRLVLVDQMPCAIVNPAWSPTELEEAGAIFTPAAVHEAVGAIASPQGEMVLRSMMAGILGTQMSAEDKERCIQRSLQMPLDLAAKLMLNHAEQDWRDVIPRISVPTLLIFAKGSVIPWKCSTWLQQKIAGSRLEVMEVAEGGEHFMFMTAEKRFNQLVVDFLAS